MQLNFVGLRHDVDGKVGTKSVGTQDIYRLDLATDKWERIQPLKDISPGPAPIYQVARRMVIDDQDRLLITEDRGNKLALFDTKAEKVTELALRSFNYRYRTTIDKNGEICAGGRHTDRAVRLDPNTGQTVG